MDASFVQAWIGFERLRRKTRATKPWRRAEPPRDCFLVRTCRHVDRYRYQRTNNLSLAYRFFRKSFEISQTDPLLYNEYGVLLYREK